MAQPFFGEVGQQNKSSGKGWVDKRGSVSTPSLNMKTESWPDVPGKTRPESNHGVGVKVKIYPVSKGL